MRKQTFFLGAVLGGLVLAAILMVAGMGVSSAWADDEPASPTPTPYNDRMPGNAYGPGLCPGPMGYGGMMGGTYGYGMMGPGMMGYGFNVEPLTVEESERILREFLKQLGREDLAVREIMVFDNHTYAQIVEKETGIGAFEVLIDPVTKAVSPEHGPTMMWNLKYSPMGGWMAAPFLSSARLPEPTISAEKAIEIAQAYLNRFLPGTTAEEPVPFYGYYTLHVTRDGEVVGMLSVNAYTGAVFPHSWHGRFIEMVETELHSE